MLFFDVHYSDGLYACVQLWQLTEKKGLFCIKAFVLTLCVSSLIGAAFSSLVSSPSQRRMITMIVSLVISISFFAALPGFDDALPELEGQSTESRSEVIDRDIEGYYISEAERSVKEELQKILAEKGLRCDDISITCTVNEYDTLAVEKAEMTVSSDKEAKEIRACLEELLPDTELLITVSKTENSENAEDTEQADR